MTHEKLILGMWFTKTQIAKAFAITRKQAESLCDTITGGQKANGGYGMNILDAEAGADRDAREDAAERLAHILECSACRACEE